MPANADEDSQVTWISVATVTNMLRATVAKHVLIIADSCYSGTLTRDAPVALAVGVDCEAELARMVDLRGRKALTSGGLEPVVDGGGGRHSVFTHALLKRLKDNHRVIDGYQLYRGMRQDVVVNADQTPTDGDIRVAGDEGGGVF